MPSSYNSDIVSINEAKQGKDLHGIVSYFLMYEF